MRNYLICCLVWRTCYADMSPRTQGFSCLSNKKAATLVLLATAFVSFSCQNYCALYQQLLYCSRFMPLMSPALGCACQKSHHISCMEYEGLCKSSGRTAELNPHKSFDKLFLFVHFTLPLTELIKVLAVVINKS